MAIIGKALPQSETIIEEIANNCGCEPAVISAILKVETGAMSFDPARRLVVRPEAHKIAVCPYLSAADKAKAKSMGFTKQPRLPGYHMDSLAAGDKTWAWIDKFADSFGEESAYWITSFGAPQIMGFNFRMCGYDSPGQMVRAFADSEDAQLRAMGAFLLSAGLREALRMRKWKTIARFYNGAAYAKNAYDIKLADAYEKSSARKAPGVALDDDHVQLGHQDLQVKAIQTRLRELGYHLEEDGDFGPETKDAVLAFQRRNGLTPDGKVGPRTHVAMLDAAPKEPNMKPVTRIIAESQTAQSAIGMITTGAVGTAVAAGKIVSEQPAPSLQDVTTGVDMAERGVSVLNKILGIGVDKMVLVMAIAGLVFGGLALYRRIQAQRLRKIG